MEQIDRHARIKQMREQHKERQEHRTERRSNLYRLAFFPISIFYMELVLRLWGSHPFGGLGLLYVLLFSLGAGLVCNLLVSLGPENVRRTIHWAILSLLTLLFIIQVVFYTIFRSYAELGMLGAAPAAISDFFLETIRMIGSAALPVLLLLLPLALFQALHLWKQRPVSQGVPRVFALATTIHLLVIGSILLSTGGLLPLRDIYRYHFTLNLAIPNFGLVTGMRLDLLYTFFGRPEADISDLVYTMAPAEPTPTPLEEREPEPEEPNIPTGYNILDIDFEALIAAETNETIREMHRFFMNRRPTPRNAFTGMFEDHNLIWIVAEAFHTLAIHPEITPTLYRLSQEGFIFPNFYTPDTGFSTTGGEFATLVSLIPRHIDAFPNTGRMYMPFGFGNMFRELGYVTFAYHNHTHTFYGRHRSHPNLGYEWIAIGSGLNITNQWPRSDLEMFQATIDDFIHADRFHVYYLTVSGHLEYNFSGNAMALRNRDAVAHLPYSTGPMAYLATQREFDLALEYLLYRLEAAGILENTVIAISADHYPFGLTDAQMEELAGTPMAEPIIDRHHSTFILWNAAMEEPVVVNAFSSSYDVMPTLANLFNLPFDSRLVMGVDLLSGADAFVPFASRSWISQLGRFNSQTREFTPHPHIDPAKIPEDHALQMAGRFNILEVQSERILAHDYYRIVLGNRGN